MTNCWRVAITIYKIHVSNINHERGNKNQSHKIQIKNISQGISFDGIYIKY